MKSKLLSFSVALLAAVCLWVYVVTVVNQEGTDTIHSVPVTFTGADQIREDLNLVVTDGSDAVVDLRVTAKRSILTKLTSSNVSVVVDVSRIKKPGEYSREFSVVYPTGVSNSDVSLSGRIEVIPFTVEHFTSKTIPVKGVLNGSVAAGYYESTMECTPRELLIEGPESLINEISYAQVILEQEALTETVTQACTFTLVDENGNAVESDYISATSDGVIVNTVEARQPVLTIKELTLTLELIPGGGATAEDALTSVEPRTVTVAGEPDILETINQIVVGRFDLAQVDTPITETLPVTIPNDLVNISDIQTAQVNVSINSNLLSTKTLRVTNFNVVNEPDGTQVDVLSMQLSVRVRGPSEEVDRLTASSLRAVVDASDLNEGTQSVPVTIEISGDTGCAALGEYSASVSLTR